jgi:hypothetical protein
MIDWHRLFGLTLVDLFTGSPFEVELEKDLSLKQQWLDVVILRKGPGEITEALPDGLDTLAEHNLLSYKSFQEGLTSWSIDELLGHFVNYRKQVSPRRERLLPMEQFQLYAISTREPAKLRSEVQLQKIQPGVFEAVWGTHRVRILVLSEMPEEPQNAVWELFSAVPARVAAGAKQYRPHTEDISTVMNGLFERYQAEGVVMPYTWEDFRRDYTRDHLQQLTPEERTKGLSLEELLRDRTVEEILAYLRQLEHQADRKLS